MRAPATTDSSRKVVLLWLAARIGVSLWVLLCSVTYPLTQLEKGMTVWPPRAPLGPWLERVLLAPWARWDVEHFLKIAEQGYRVDDGTLSFHPLYPALGKAVGSLVGGHELWGLFIVSNVSCLLMLLALERLARLDRPRDEAYRSCLFLLLLPTAFVLFAPYTEPLFLLCSVLALLMARRGQWWLAGVSGGLAALTRQQGILLVVPLAWELWEASRRSWRELLPRWRDGLSLLLTPLGLGVWLVYRNMALGDTEFAWRRPYTLVYGMLISRSASHIVTDQSITFPWEAVWLAMSHPSPTNLIDLLLGGFYLVLLMACGRRLWRLRPSYLLYTAVTVVVSFSLSTGLPHSYMGLPRHCLLAFPLGILLATMRRQELIVISVKVSGLLLLLVLSVFYVWKILWVP